MNHNVAEFLDRRKWKLPALEDASSWPLEQGQRAQFGAGFSETDGTKGREKWGALG